MKPDVITTSDGTYRRIRAQSVPDESGAFGIELWAKDGVDPKQFVYHQLLFKNEPEFIRMERGDLSIPGY